MSLKATIPRVFDSDSGKYSVYLVLVEIGAKKFQLEKRYSDFANLKAEMEALYGEDVPYNFPKKHLLRSTVGNPSLAESRRAQLETFLKSILEDATQNKWKKSLPFKEFLNLPPGIFSTVDDSTKEKLNSAWVLSSKNDQPIEDLTTWIETARETKDTLRDARSKVYTSPSETRKLLILARVRFDGLTSGLDSVTSKQIIGEGEAQRRRELLHSLKREHQDIENLLSNISQFPEESQSARRLPIGQVKSQLFKGRVLGQPQETERTRGLNDQQLLQVQKQDFQDQEKELEQLSKVIQRQKELGVAINEELALQNELLDELDSEVDRTSAKLHYANKRVGKFT